MEILLEKYNHNFDFLNRNSFCLAHSIICSGSDKMSPSLLTWSQQVQFHWAVCFNFTSQKLEKKKWKNSNLNIKFLFKFLVELLLSFFLILSLLVHYGPSILHKVIYQHRPSSLLIIVPKVIIHCHCKVKQEVPSVFRN